MKYPGNDAGWVSSRPGAATSGLILMNEMIRMYLQTARCSLHAHLTHEHCPLACCSQANCPLGTGEGKREFWDQSITVKLFNVQ